jgi:hypothetical protein
MRFTISSRFDFTKVTFVKNFESDIQMFHSRTQIRDHNFMCVSLVRHVITWLNSRHHERGKIHEINVKFVREFSFWQIYYLISIPLISELTLNSFGSQNGKIGFNGESLAGF